MRRRRGLAATAAGADSSRPALPRWRKNAARPSGASAAPKRASVRCRIPSTDVSPSHCCVMNRSTSPRRKKSPVRGSFTIATVPSVVVCSRTSRSRRSSGGAEITPRPGPRRPPEVLRRPSCYCPPRHCLSTTAVLIVVVVVMVVVVFIVAHGDADGNATDEVGRDALLEFLEGRVQVFHETLVPFPRETDRKSTRLNSSHLVISYAV